VKNDTEFFVQKYKDEYLRDRPFVKYPGKIEPSLPKSTSKSYPSGSAAIAIAWATVLAEFYPAKREALLKHADEIALNRVIGGVHFQSDIEAGKQLGAKVVEVLKSNQNFSAEFNKLKKENGAREKSANH
jgi:acid phosphatase (class A)